MRNRYTISQAGCFLLGLVALSLLSSPATRADAPLAERRDIAIPAGAVVMGANLLRPQGEAGDLPVIVMAHGSAPSTRDDLSFYTAIALEMGFAVLIFDKRGTGSSTGQYEPFTVADSERIFHDLAADIAHAARWVAQQDGIDATRLGLMGGSQAGWVMPIVPSLLSHDDDPRVAFIIAGAGVTVTAGEESIHELALRRALSRDCRRNACAGELVPDFAMIDAADDRLREYDGPHGYDPFENLSRLEIPALWIFGLYDSVIPVRPSIDRLRTMIADGHDNHDVRVLPFADHDFTNLATGRTYELTPMLRDWLAEAGILDTGARPAGGSIARPKRISPIFRSHPPKGES